MLSLAGQGEAWHWQLAHVLPEAVASRLCGCLGLSSRLLASSPPLLCAPTPACSVGPRAWASWGSHPLQPLLGVLSAVFSPWPAHTVLSPRGWAQRRAHDKGSPSEYLLTKLMKGKKKYP